MSSGEANYHEHLAYLSDDRLKGFSSEVFRSAIRLPVLGAILELTPNIEEDAFYQRQICGLTLVDAGGVSHEIQRICKQDMIRKSGKAMDSERIVPYVRLASQRWSIVDVALNAARQELT